MSPSLPLTPGLAVALAVLAAVPSAVGAQAGETVLRGTVVDARTAAPVSDATVVLEPERTGVFPGTSSGFAASSRTVTTDVRGAYGFANLAPGVYRLYVTRFGYRSYSVVVELRGSAGSVSVGLEAEPIALEPLRGRARARGPYAAGAFGPDPEVARLWAVDLRRRQFLTTDVRELTRADVLEGVTLGEPDVFRAIQRLPGVSTRSDYTAEVWTRGAPWSQTRVYYDGVPLYNPLHALGMLSGIGSSAIGTVWFHPGVRPTAMAEGAAGVLDLRSRRAAGGGAMNLEADLSLMTAGASLDQRVLEGRAGWRLTGRSSHLDWLADLARRASGREGAAFPYGFTEVSGHADAWLGERSAVEASFLWEGDHLASNDPGDPVRAEWGNSLVQGTWSTRLGDLNVQHSLGHSAHRGSVADNADGHDPATGSITGPLELAGGRIGYLGLRGALWPEPRSMAGAPWTLGYELSRQRVDYSGPVPLPIPRSSADQLATSESGGGGAEPVSVEWHGALPQLAVWGEASWAPAPRWSVRTGLRLEAGDALANLPAARLAPRLSARYTPEPDVSLSAGYARIHQYVQALAPSGVQMASLVSTDVWLLAGPRIPAIRSDILTAGVEVALERGRIGALNVFGRSATGVAVPDPEPGPVLDRAVFVVAGATAYGVEASVRQLTGPVTGSVSYSWSRSRVAVDGLVFPSAADRTHVFDATAMVRVLEPLRFGAAFTAATGVPFTRTISDPDECAAEPRCDPDTLPWAGDPNAVRAPTYASLDLLVDWSTRVAGLDVGVYGQLRNALGRENAVVYTGNDAGCIAVGCSIEALRNQYERGVPRLPVIGVRVRR